MKKTLYALLVAILCLGMLSCTQESETALDDIETVSPNEPEVEPETPPIIPVEILSVLNGENVFLLDNENWIYIEDFVFPSSQKGLAEYTSLQYTLIDFDSDGKSELVINVPQEDVLILKHNDVSYGVSFDSITIQVLYDDGTFIRNYTDDKGHHHGRSKLEFSDNAFKPVELCRTSEYSKTGETGYYIGEKAVTSSELIEYEGTFSNREVTFYPLNYIPHISETPSINKYELKFDSGVHILPAEDENTKTIVIKFPEITLGYTEPELVEPENFEWGDYRPFVRYMIDSYGDLGNTPIYSYSFLGRGINSLTEGNALYEKLNNKYKKTFERSEEDISHFESYEKNALPLTKESRVIYVSEDCSEIGNFYLEKAEPVLCDYLSNTGLPIYNYNTWNGVYESYKNGELAYTSAIPHNKNGYIDYTDGGTFRNIPYERLTHQYSGIYPIFCHNNRNTEVYCQYYDRNKKLIMVYSTAENSLKYKIAMDFHQGAIDTYTEIHQIFDDRYLLISFLDYFNGHGPCNNLYLLDLETEALSKINDYCFNPVLSPDGKYLIYTNYYEFGQGVNSPDNENYKMGYGFYVKNLENGETTFFKNPYKNDWQTHNQPLMWVDSKALESVIGE